MSAFVCSHLHISTIAKAYLDYKMHRRSGEALGFEMAEKFGYGHLVSSAADALMLANQLAVNHRYQRGPVEDVSVSQKGKDLEPLALVKLINCLMYQCNEFYDEDQSQAANYVRAVLKQLQALKEHLVSRACDGFPWEI